MLGEQLVAVPDEELGEAVLHPYKPEFALHYQPVINHLPLVLANMLKRTTSAPPIERIPGVLWELGQVGTRHGSMPAWYVRRLVDCHTAIHEALTQFAQGSSGLLLIGDAVRDGYQNLPGIRRILTIAESLDPWSERPQIDQRLLDNIFQTVPSEFANLPFEMPADKSSIRDNTTEEIYELSNQQCELFYFLLVKLKDGHSKVKLKDVLAAAGYSTSYTSLNTPLNKRADLLKILSLKKGFVSLVPGAK